ncbi:MAG: hypothetical protein DRN81_01355 [Thermoproteota archaeon]|nr:MAG: hypothetical protein DRN81_01355 [Candidatus Korarchaeota archaeon]
MESPFGKPQRINPENVTYGYESFAGFDVEIVYVKNELKNEYHLKNNGQGSTDEEILNSLIRLVGKDCEVGFVDRTGIITLDYPIYVIVKNPIIEDEMQNIWIDLEQLLKKE